MAASDRDLASLIRSPSLLRTLDDAASWTLSARAAMTRWLFYLKGTVPWSFESRVPSLRDDGEAEETVQRVFLDVFRAMNQFDSARGSFKTWLLQYAYHRTINRREHLQANHFYNREELDELAPAELFYGGGHLLCLPSQEVACLVEQVLALLEPHQRKVIELTYFEGLTAEEVAKVTGNSASSVRNNLYRGLSKLRNAVLENYKTRENSASERKASTKGMLVEQPRTL